MRDWFPGMELGIVSSVREHIEIVEGALGPKARIVGHRIRVVDVVSSYVHRGLSAEEIVEEWPTITFADVHAALVYYYDNREAIEQWMEDDRAYVEKMQREAGPSLLEEKRRQLHEKAASAGSDSDVP